MKSTKKIIIPIVAICAILLIAIIIVVSNSDKSRSNMYDNNDYQYNTTEYHIDSVEDVTEKQYIKNPIGTETLQYPSQNDIFTYDVYNTYVEITGSVKDNLTGELKIPETLENLPVRSISRNAFGGPGEGFTAPGYSISSLILPNNLYQVSDSAFYRCENLKSITFGDKLTTIGSMAFAHTNITSVKIPDTVTDVGTNIFLECKKLKKVSIGKSMNSIPDSMFHACSNLSNIEWNNSITIIEQQAFSGTAFETIDLPNTITKIEGKAFSYMDNLKEITIPDSVTEISGYFLLEHCENLKRVTIGKGLTSIPEYTFSNSPSITELIIPENVSDIHSNIFGEGTFSPYSKPIIYGEKGSAAANFASSKSLSFKIIKNWFIKD